ncbi:hypothetical protein OAE37_03245 [Pirellulaceae bacterium]|nr:hypothetical protein [Pirellulaceae bacterium]
MIAKQTANRKKVFAYCKDGNLVFELGYGTYWCKVDGTFTGKVKIEPKFIRIFVKKWKLRKQTVDIKCFVNEIQLDGQVLPCKIEGVAAQDLESSSENTSTRQEIINESVGHNQLSLLSLLVASRNRSKSNDKDPLNPIYDAAWKQMEEILNQVAEVLKPLDITTDDLRELVNTKLNYVVKNQ